MPRKAVAALILLLAAFVPQGCAPADPGVTGSAEAGGVTITLDRFGVGSVFRPGEFTAIRVAIRSTLSEITSAWVQWEVPNADGDVAEYGRSIALQPGQAVMRWLYAPIPPGATASTVWSLRVFEERDGRRRGELASAKISAALANATAEPIDKGLIAVIGRTHMGLNDLSNKWTVRPSPPGAHEDTRIVFGIAPEELPDKWEGWKGFEMVAWGDALPQGIGSEAAAALREYVQRGGHLFITLPEDGDPWGLGRLGVTEFDDLLPARTPETVPLKVEGVRLSELLPVLSKHATVDRDLALSIRVFKTITAPGQPPEEEETLDNQFEPLIALPDGRVVVVQRPYGFGRVTVSGLDLTSNQVLSVTRGRPQGDVFWNRVLARRADTPEASELVAMRDRERLGGATANEVNIGRGDLFSSELNMSRRAGQLMLLALVLFVAYWSLGGPLGFALLRKTRQVQHSWLAFAAAAAVFTAIASGSVALLRQGQVQVRHVTFLDEIEYLPDDPRAALDQRKLVRGVSFLSLYLPDYGRREVRLAPLEGDPARQRDLLASWIPPGQETQTFPNTTRYGVDVGRDDARLELPARSTATQLYAHWLGAAAQMPSIQTPIVVSGVTEDQLTGSIVNNLPGPLLNVVLIHIKNNRLSTRSYFTSGGAAAPWVQPMRSGSPLNNGSMWVVPRWEAGQTLDLAAIGRSINLESNLAQRYTDNYKSSSGSFTSLPSTAALTEPERRRFIEMLSVYHQLAPPTYIKSDGQSDPPTVVVRRELGRDLDLSAWFNRPCLILIGYLEGSALPLPLRVENETPESSGLTVVRWVCPLPLDDAQVRGRGQSPEPARPAM